MKQSAAIGPSPVGRICAFLAPFLILLAGCTPTSVNQNADQPDVIVNWSKGEAGLNVYTGPTEWAAGLKDTWRGKVAKADLPSGFWDFRSCQVSRLGAPQFIVAVFHIDRKEIMLFQGGEISGDFSTTALPSDRIFAYSDADTVRALREFLMRNVDPKWHGAIASIKPTDKPCLNR